jgi:hypothetical protein
MACRAALLAVLPSTGSALAVHRASLRDVGHLDDNAESSELERMLMPGESDCQVAPEGSDCYKSVEYLRSQGFKAHPMWYPGYTSESSFEEVQDMLHGLEKARCPKPCFAQLAQVSPRRNKAASMAKFDCRDTIVGDLCYASVAWLKEVGFGLHPDWYPDLDKNSSAASIQAELHRKGKSDCSQPCSPTEAAQEKAKAHMESMEMATETQETQYDDCMDAVVGTQCYTDVSYGIAEGIRKHPDFYVGLSEGSNFKQIQEYLYLNNRSFCERPCPGKKMTLDMIVNNYEGTREKKRIQDMSIDELTRYLTGEWDGYVTKVFSSPDDHSTFEKRKYNPTTTTPVAEAMPLPALDGNTSEEAATIEPEKPASDDAGVADAPAQEVASDAKGEAASNVTDEAASNVTAESPPSQEEEAVRDTEAELQAEAQRKVEAERLAKEAAEAADALDKPFPETGIIPQTDAARELLVCLLKLRDVTAETLGDIKGECEEKMPLEGSEREALVKEAMRYFLWAQHHVQFLKAHPKAEATEAQAEEAGAEEAKAEEANAEDAKSKDQDVVDEPMPEIDSSLGEATVAAPDPEPAASERAETPEEMEQRLRKQLMEELAAQTTTVAPHKETEEEMRERIKAEVMRELAMAKPASN